MDPKQSNDQLPFMKMGEAFSRSEIEWFKEFERDIELWSAVDILFPDPPRRA